MTLLQLAINGVALGAAYALIALGFVFIVNATGAVNFAHGDLVMAGGYVAVGLGAMAPLPMIVLLPVVAAIISVVSVKIRSTGAGRRNAWRGPQPPGDQA